VLSRLLSNRDDRAVPQSQTELITKRPDSP
jgi:hypothetical protein